MEIKNNNKKEEIELIDYIRVILKRKIWLFWIFVSFVLLGLVVTLFTPKVYESEAIVRLSAFSGNTSETPEEALEVIKGKSALKEIAQTISEKGRQEEKLNELKGNLSVKTKLGTNIIIIATQGKTAQSAQRTAQTVADFIIKKYKVPMVQKREIFQERIKDINNQINVEKELFKSLQSKIDRLGEPSNETQALILDVYLKNQQVLSRNINKFNAELNKTKMDLFEFQDPYIASSPSLPNRKIKPSLKLNLIITGFLGILIGLFWIFCLEWWENNKEKLKK